MRTFATLVVLSLIAGGCDEPTGNLDNNQVQGDIGGREFFIKKVAPEFAESCNACHAELDDGCTPLFMTSDPEACYKALKEYAGGGLVVHPDDSNLILHGAHTGPALTGTQAALVREWLLLEAPTPPERTQLGALQEFGNCMDFDVFDESGVHYLAFQQSASGGSCGGCHLAGLGGTWISFNKSEMFDYNTSLPWVKRWVRAKFENGVFIDLEPSNRLIDKPELATACSERHVAADVTVANENAIQVFVNTTLDAWRSGTCE